MALLQNPAASQKILREGGVYLRAPQWPDFDEWANLRTESRAFLSPWEPSWPPDDLTRPAFRRRLRRYAQDLRDGSAYPFFVFREEDDALVGACNLSGLRRGVLQTGSLGYWVGERYAQRGYTRNAVRAVLRFAFDSLSLHRVEAACLPQNEASRRLLESTGFRLEGYARDYLRINGAWRDHVLFGILARDAFSTAPPGADPGVLELEANLPHAIEQGRIEPHFQPIVSLRSGEPVGYEALARWRHPIRGLLGAHSFAPIAERGGLGPALARRMLAASAGELRTWRRLRGAGERLYIGVNISAADLGVMDLAGEVGVMRQRFELPQGVLRLEITESGAIEDVAAAGEALAAARAAGASIALDDFGAGHSSLSRLSELPLDAVKTDRALAQRACEDPAAASVLKAVVGIAKDLKLQAIAEGVETKQARDKVAALGFDAAQGHLIGDPLPGGEVERALKGRGN